MSKPKRRPEWKQESPRAQLVSTIMGIQGHQLNLESGIITGKQFLEKTDFMFRWAQELLQLLPDTAWEPEEEPEAYEETGPWAPDAYEKRCDDEYRRDVAGTDPNETNDTE